MSIVNFGVIRGIRVDCDQRGWIAAFSCGVLALTISACSATTDGAAEEQVSQSDQALVSPTAAVWVAQGPGPMLNGQASTWPATDKNPVAGAVQAIATHPSNANI